MPARYLACSGEPAELALIGALLEAEGFSLALEDGALRVWTRGGLAPPAVRLRPGVVVIGRWRGRLEAEVAKPAYRAREFRDLGWGEYLAILAEGALVPRVFRSPSGALDALTWRRGELRFLADDLDGVPEAVWPEAFALDWDEVARIVRHPAAAAGGEAFIGLHSITPGDLQLLGGDNAETIWRPAASVRPSADVDVAAELRTKVFEAVDQVAADAGGMLLEVSGGLDSSIVALSVARCGRAGQVGTALNQHSAEAEGDERPWAQAVCRAAGVPLISIEKPVGRLEEVDFRVLGSGVRPALEGLDPLRDRRYLEIAGAVGARSLMTGQGGDAVFFQMPSAAVMGDLMRSEGLRSAFGHRGCELAIWQRRSIWSLAREALFDAPRLEASPMARFLGPRARDAPPGPSHPWLVDLGELPPGKRLQIAHLVLCQLKFGRSLRGDGLEILHPLLSQPVVETCLAIPSYELVRGGRDRALARRAFADLLPPEVAERRSKGMLPTLYARRVAASLDVLRPWLLEGKLVAEGVLNRRQVEAALTSEDLLWRADGIRLLQAAMVEAWVRHWS